MAGQTASPDSREMVIELYWRALQVREAFTVEFPMCRRDGVYRWMLAQAVPRFLDDQTFAGYVATLVDITDYHDAILEVKKQVLCTSAVAMPLVSSISCSIRKAK